MSEILVYSRPNGRRMIGEIIDIRPDGFQWGSGERSDPFSIVRVRGELDAARLAKVRRRMNRRGLRVRLTKIPTTRIGLTGLRDALRDEQERTIDQWAEPVENVAVP